MEIPQVVNDESIFREVLQAARSGDNTARERLYRDFGPYFRRVITRRLKALHLEWATTPHDVFDTVVLRVWQEDALGLLSGQVEFLKYVSRAVHREIQDLRRNLTAGRRDYRRLESLDGDSIATNTDPARGASCREELESIRSQLSEQNRQILDMWLSGSGWGDIGQTFGLASEIVRKRLQRSLEAIRRTVCD
jgi:RNA polymerase sigma factor (sigma-70 family)